ncbi:NYN domain-containing protein [Stutzerimonas sp. Brlt_13]|uniref:NYN domain-containing protein n=1 Tax=Stutzerimonas TaxID=2901164 RepID=UPI001BD240C0|nr:NYN domain-containing protein [Stutzerimonas stutzeri]MBS9723685.1 NYN domain-containing protein [Stutzerimonas stutzeri]MDH0424247.1 NYN domain-containing protein [Stutzerimonas stutzeri]
MQRVIAYVDGFNLYFGLKDSQFKKYYWLDLPAMATALLRPDQQLVATHYFTARIRTNGRNADDAKRQTTYIDALAAQSNLTVHKGHYLEKTQRCKSCGASWKVYEEKMTDVNIAAEMLADAYEDRFDTAFVISGDSDLTTPIQQVRKRFPNKRLIVVFPPNRQSAQLKKAANGYLSIGEDKLRQNQLPNTVMTSSGFALHRPTHWK